MSLPTVGILAGMGPRSTAPFIDLVITECQIQYGARHDIDFPKMMICSQPAPFYEDRPVDHPALMAAIKDGLQDLEATGAAFLAIACNTAHIYYSHLASAVRVPLLNMLELAVSALPASVNHVALLAARATADAGIYQERLHQRGTAVISISWQQDVDDLLTAIRASKDSADIKQRWAQILKKVISNGADAILIACLDLSGMVEHLDATIPVIDASQCLAREIVREWLKLRG